jgi:hypothetical protein
MVQITITEKDYNENNLLYIQSAISEFLTRAGCSVYLEKGSGRAKLTVNCSECYAEAIRGEISDKVAEIIAIKYKYEYFKSILRIGGLCECEKEILITSLIAADLEDDKKYTFDRVKVYRDITVDGIFYFRLKQLKKKWKDVAEYIPTCFLNTQLKEFITYLLENKKRRVYIDDGRVYDWHYRRLKRSSLLGGDEVKILKEVLLSNGGEVELIGDIPKDDEYYLKEYYSDKLYFSKRRPNEEKYLN